MKNITLGSVDLVTFHLQKYVEEHLEIRCIIKIEMIHNFYTNHSLNSGALSFFFFFLFSCNIRLFNHQNKASQILVLIKPSLLRLPAL